MLLMTGIGALAAAIPVPEAGAYPADRVPAPAQPPPPGAQTPTYLFQDEFDGPAGSAPDPAKWTTARARELIKNPVFWDRPENMGQYRDDRRNVFLDGNSNLVIRATRENGKYYSGKIQSTWWGSIGCTFEARIKLNCLTAGCWPAWWVMNDHPVVGGEIDLVEWYGNGEWPSGTTVARTIGRHIIRDLPDGGGQRVAHLAHDMESRRHVLLARLCRRRRTILRGSGELPRGLAVQLPRLPDVSGVESRG